MSEVGGPRPGTVLGDVAKPVFAVLPDPASLFLGRSKRLEALAPKHELEPYLRFLAALTRAQHEAQPELERATLPSFERIGQALEYGMPPVSRTLFEADETALTTIERVCVRLADAKVPPQTAAALAAVRGATTEERRVMIAAALADTAPAEQDLARRVLVLAGLQVHFARMASMLEAGDLKPVAASACPVCGSAPMTSSVVGWPGAHNTRYCTCSLCGTMWNVVRVTCLLCSSTDGISYRAIEGRPDTVKAETCDKCRGYVKILYQVKDPALEALADDVATLGLDIMLAEEGWRRGGQNPFLLGY
jgi:FdhE protein